MHEEIRNLASKRQEPYPLSQVASVQRFRFLNHHFFMKLTAKGSKLIFSFSLLTMLLFIITTLKGKGPKIWKKKIFSYFLKYIFKISIKYTYSWVLINLRAEKAGRWWGFLNWILIHIPAVHWGSDGPFAVGAWAGPAKDGGRGTAAGYHLESPITAVHRHHLQHLPHHEAAVFEFLLPKNK